MEALEEALRLIKQAKIVMALSQNYDMAAKLLDTQKALEKKINQQWAENVLKNVAP